MQDPSDQASSGDVGKLPKEFFGMGSIQSIDQSKKLITLDHQPMPALNMPAMSMEFQVSPDVDLTKFNVDQEIDFMVIVQDGNKYVITKINPVEENKQPSRKSGSK